MTQPGKFSIAGEGLNVGKDGSEPVTMTTRARRPGPSPAARSAARRSTSAAAGQPFVDLAAEARMAFMRD